MIVIVEVKYGENTDFIQNTCFIESNNMAIEKTFRETINFHKRYFPSVITWHKKHLSNQVVSIT